MSSTFHDKSNAFLKEESRSNWHDKALWYVREKRDNAMSDVPDWEKLRTAASRIKAHTLTHLDAYLLDFEAAAAANGVRVHWAKDATEHNRAIYEILKGHEVTKVVKSKSMLTEECGLNPYLEARGVEVIDTDLGERIIQLKGEPPSHIVLPAIHITKEEVSEIFHSAWGTQQGNSDPKYLTLAARASLREDFMTSGAAITGVNFAIAETGEVVVCTNEGNADLGTHIHPLQIHSMGIEKLIPRRTDLGVFTRLLARSATGQPITVYTSHFQRPKPGGEMHIVIVDNGRSRRLGEETFWSSLKCIRCGACINTCPIYRRSGGHSYGHTIPGPIGSILAPDTDLRRYSQLPFASTLCGSCSEVCPVQIDIHNQLYRWRQVAVGQGQVSGLKSRMMRIAGKILANPRWYRRVMSMMRWGMKWLPASWLHHRWNAWAKGRSMPQIKNKNDE